MKNFVLGLSLVFNFCISGTAYSAGQASIKSRVFVPGMRVGAVTATSTSETIVADYGQQNVTEKDLCYTGREDEELPCVWIFKNTPNQIQVFFEKDDLGNEVVESVLISSPSSEEASNWTSLDGLRTGVSLMKLAELNSKEVLFSGFGWDYGGQIYSFSDQGTLSGTLPVDHEIRKISIALSEPYENDYYAENSTYFIGDKSLSTADPKVKPVLKDVKVTSIRVHLYSSKGKTESPSILHLMDQLMALSEVMVKGSEVISEDGKQRTTLRGVISTMTTPDTSSVVYYREVRSNCAVSDFNEKEYSCTLTLQENVMDSKEGHSGESAIIFQFEIDELGIIKSPTLNVLFAG